MGTELESLDSRLRRLERLEAQFRGFQVLAGMLLVTVIGMAQRGCVNFDAVRSKQLVLAGEIKRHEEMPHNVDEDAIGSMQQIDKEHGERLRLIEHRLHLRKPR